MRRIAILLAAAAVWLLMTTFPSVGADNGTVNATVSTPTPCLTLDQTSVDFGVVPFSDGGTSFALRPVEVTNCAGGGVGENLFVKGTDATSAKSQTVWTLSGQNTAPCLLPDNWFGLYVATITTIRSDVFNSVGSIPGDGSLPFNLGIDMPCLGSDGQGETMGFDVSFLVTIP